MPNKSVKDERAERRVMKIVLVAGGAGHIDSYKVKRLLSGDYHSVAYESL
jgi:hypothetical protein